MAQDAQGFLWIGTETGLFRYDGDGVTRFGRVEGLPGELVDFVLAAPDDRIWVRTRNKISRRTHDRFEPIDLPASAGALRDGYQTFAVNARGDLFVSTQIGLLHQRSDSSIHDLFRVGSKGVPAEIDAIACAPDDTIWFAAGNEIGRLRRGWPEPENFTALDLAADEHVISLLPASEGRIWIRTGSRVGMIRLEAEPPAVGWFPETLPIANTQGGPGLDRHGNLLLPTASGLYWYADSPDTNTDKEAVQDQPRWRLIDHRSGLTSSAVASVLEDREGGIWIGTTGAGLDYWPGSKQWSAWTEVEGLPDELILGVVRDHRGRLWVAANTAVCYWDPHTAQWHTVTLGGEHLGARQITITPDGAVWTVVARKAIYRFDGNQEHPTDQAVPLPEGWKPRRISAGPDNSIWADGKDSLHEIRYEHGHFAINSVAAPDRNAGTTRNVSVATSGVVWSAGPKGVSRYDHGAWQYFGKKDGLSSEVGGEIQAIDENRVWLRYDDENRLGLLRWQDSRVRVTNIDQAMCGLGADQHQNVWAAVDKGVLRISPDGTQRIFTEADGLIWNDLNCGAMWQESDGSILLGTSKGLARYDANEEEPKRRQPTVVITSAIFGRTEHLQEMTPEVKYRDATLLARFAAPVFRDASNVSCRYRLGGLETEFTETKLREARYPSLPAGQYSFQVSCGSSQLGQSSVVEYPFIVLAPWWQTWWARGSGGLAAILLLCGMAWLRQRRHRIEKERLERAVAERSAELAKANRELQEASLSDPLTGVRNRRFFQSTIEADASQALRAYRGFGNYSLDHRDLLFFLVDIDHFKAVNDEHGHDAGDRVLVQIAARLTTLIRESDFLIRWGGEEFLVVFRSAQRSDAELLASRILKAINGAEFDLGSGRLLRRSCSVGWAAFPWLPPSCSDLSVDETLRLADRGLYIAKHQGRNRAVGLVAAAETPMLGSPASGNVVTKPDKYSAVEQLVEHDLIREVHTIGDAAAAAAV